MTAISSSAIRLSYLWPCNAAHAAATLSATHGIRISPDQVELRWESECVDHPLLHELGTRPAWGFKRTEAVTVALSMIVKEHKAGGVAA